ncbi:hypothetical protein CEUSTIGMA_g12869.t1 [Chlamydomonas eustigma]|uniref:Lon protease homolog n=1 Tax=Chlamydomonas eustigma TaxID=1157962 RepID=A0A250XR05_9CHLO|nr:hypothetical protein CEUSTIGMA_g12869.t1 [Chlamydomonas eustigma]|eukprot:GAX85453.1 hypothetical protein CEUSTIGMA_g12869.t1 [Chlamydomonas eustigma]
MSICSSNAALLQRSIGDILRQRRTYQNSVLNTLTARSFSSKEDDVPEDGKQPGLMSTIFGRMRGSNAKTESQAEKSVAKSDGEPSENALVVSSPERKHHKVYVVELSRKPLFPGIYTPVMVNKNEKLIKEIMDTKKQGAQAYVGAFLRREPKDATKPLDSTTQTETSASSSLNSSTIDLDSTVDPAAQLYEIGTFSQVHTILPGDSADSAQLLLLGHRRIRRTAIVSADPLRVRIEHLRDESYSNNDILKATSMEIVNTMRDLLHLNPLYGEQFRTLLSLSGSIDLQDMSRLVDAAASLTSADDAKLQSILEEVNVPDRASDVLMLLKKEVELCKLQADIRDQVESKITKDQRRMLLMEQLKSIKKELGLERDDKSALLQKFQERWEPRKALAPEDACRVVEEEMAKLGGLEPSSPEFNVTRNYLEWLTALPWGQHSKEIFDVAHAKQVLDEDHHGLEDVKERILEFIAVSRLRGSAQGKILCLVGPPGVGKTSIGRSIARTLHRKYYRFSVGGLYDVAEIKGHRRTYVGAMPGKIVQCLKSTGTSNPLVLIDEVDKLGRGHQGDPASALLELLDPEQNSGFVDHYLDVPVDLSKVLFVCTANTLDTIPGPLLDRMEIIRLSGYASDEKRAIARRYLEPTAALEAGVPSGAASLADSAMELLINEYCREAGVRNLKKQLEKVYRKVALKLVKSDKLEITPLAAQEDQKVKSEEASAASSGQDVSESDGALPNLSAGDSSTSQDGQSSETSGSAPSVSQEAEKGPTKKSEAQQKVSYSGEPLLIDDASLKDYCGQPPFAQDRIYVSTPPGVVMGLAWTSMGGATLYVEAARVHESEAKGAMTTTGQLGDVFRESTAIAHTFARRFLSDVDSENKFFSTAAVHVHVPAGSTPKDGPSAGCTIVTALLSLALNKPVAADLAMTGEVTLTGRILPIGGVKEKVLAARRSGVKLIVFPEANKRDYDELSEDLRRDLTPYFVSHYEQIFKLALQYDKN